MQGLIHNKSEGPKHEDVSESNCNLFSGPYLFNYAVFLLREARCNHWRGWKKICFLIYLCKPGHPPVVADDFICQSRVPDIIGLQSGCCKIVCGPLCFRRLEQVYILSLQHRLIKIIHVHLLKHEVSYRRLWSGITENGENNNNVNILLKLPSCSTLQKS